MKKILFPTDFSAAAENAFVVALRLAKKTGACIVTMHSYQIPELRGANLPYSIRQIYDTMNLEEFEDYRDEVPALRQIAEREGLSSVQLSHVMEAGDPIPSIIEQAKKEKADLIVMGTTGATGSKEIFLGSVAAEVMENAHCPVLAVPQAAKSDGRFDKIAFTTAFKQEDKLALEWLEKWARPFEADIFCIHADEKHAEPLAHQMDELKLDFLAHRNIHFEVLETDNFEKSINKYLTENKIDLLAMVIHKRNFFLELFNFSQTKKLAFHLNTPMLALQANQFAEGRVKYSLPVFDLA